MSRMAAPFVPKSSCTPLKASIINFMGSLCSFPGLVPLIQEWPQEPSLQKTTHSCCVFCWSLAIRLSEISSRGNPTNKFRNVRKGRFQHGPPSATTKWWSSISQPAGALRRICALRLASELETPTSSKSSQKRVCKKLPTPDRARNKCLNKPVLKTKMILFKTGTIAKNLILSIISQVGGLY